MKNKNIFLKKNVKYFAYIPGLIDNTCSQIKIDNKYFLEQTDPAQGGYFYLKPIKKNVLKLEDIIFYFNCLSFENESPFWIFENGNDIKLFDSIDPFNKYENNPFCLLDEIQFLKFGIILISFLDNEEDDNFIIKLMYSKKYHNKKNELSLYSQALKQSDPFFEYLNYYRIIESIEKSNGKGWIKENIENINDFNFGKLKGATQNKTKKIEIDTYEILKNKYSERLKYIKKNIGMPIEKYLYNVNRCGIAHGKDPIDFNIHLSEIQSDVYVMKLLAKMAIIKKL